MIEVGREEDIIQLSGKFIDNFAQRKLDRLQTSDAAARTHQPEGRRAVDFQPAHLRLQPLVVEAWLYLKP